MGKPGQRVEQDELRARMRAVGMSHDEIAVEFARRYRIRPRAAHRVAHGWTQQQAADHINAHAARTGLDPDGAATRTAPWLSELENWPVPLRRRPTPQLLALLAEVYGTTVHNLLDLDDRENMPPADLMLISQIRKGLPTARQDSEGKTVREAVIGGVSLTTTTEIAADNGGFAHQFDLVPEPDVFGQPSAIGVDITDPTEHWVELLGLVAGKSNDGGPGSVWSLARGQLALLDACRRTSPVENRQLLAVQARWSEFLSWLADNLGRPRSGRMWAELAYSQATEAGDRRTASYVLMRRAQQAADQGRGWEAVALGEGATALDSSSVCTAALCLVRQAHGHALNRDAAASRAAVRQAVRLLAGAEVDPDPLDGHCTDLYVAAYEGRCRLLLGDLDGATRMLEEVLANWPDGLRQDEVMWRAWLADAHTAAGRMAEAGAEGLRALELAQATGSARADTVLDSMAGVLAGADRVVEVGQFLAACRVVSAARRRQPFL
ncbi:helix-turn-helix transcriptional regulator [Frankia sp. Cas3]|uniref:helix-turn-helix transcriptional regulator n=1 Tax=Frankia sp. Cas3 TaxID=3073926 RepID=UPI002AD53542|nr:helix-turn-helix transcriptional regulator [Frankia sp. Cas3]